VNPHTKFPRYIKTINLASQTGTYFGPLEEKHSAHKLVHLMESLFDLCRDYSILIQSPHAGPCAWKQMGKCVGPCDGTISLEAYGELVAHSAAVLSDPKTHIEQETQRMNAAATELRFETAQKIKLHIQQLSQLGKGPFRHVRPLEQFNFLSLQRGPRANTAKMFLITPGHIEELANLIDEPHHPSDLLQLALTRAAQRPQRMNEFAEELIAIVAHHLFIARHKQGVFLDLAHLDDKSLQKGYRDLMTQKAQEPDEGEGVTKELQAM
jgi:excinuclease UvrABC nuclease subunit